MKHASSIGGAFDFGRNLRAYTDSGAQIEREEELIKHRRDEDHTVGNGHFIKLEKLYSTHRQALLKILEGISIIAVTACATVAGIGSLEGKEKPVPQDDVSSVSEDVVSQVSDIYVLTEEGGWYYRGR